jgi:NAD(P)-dependent dehydrogenase (short-subunit alcohol dehydrogenase family)
MPDTHSKVTIVIGASGGVGKAVAFGDLTAGEVVLARFFVEGRQDGASPREHWRVNHSQ